MVIKPSTAMQQHYRELADYCIETGEPVFLTNEGEGELVVMSIHAWQEERSRIQIEEALLKIETEERMGTIEYITKDDFFAGIDRIIDEATIR